MMATLMNDDKKKIGKQVLKSLIREIDPNRDFQLGFTGKESIDTFDISQKLIITITLVDEYLCSQFIDRYPTSESFEVKFKNHLHYYLDICNCGENLSLESATFRKFNAYDLYYDDEDYIEASLELIVVLH